MVDEDSLINCLPDENAEWQPRKVAQLLQFALYRQKKPFCSVSDGYLRVAPNRDNRLYRFCIQVFRICSDTADRNNRDNRRNESG